MKIKIFKTFSKDLDYVTFNFLPAITIDHFCDGPKCLFIGWLTWGLQLKW